MKNSSFKDNKIEEKVQKDEQHEKNFKKASELCQKELEKPEVLAVFQRLKDK